jgi:hypothetical protein
MFLDHGETVEAFPMFPDSAGGGDLVGAPRVIDLTRTPVGLDGEIRRRFELRGAACDARAPVHIGACGDALEVTMAELPSPVEMMPCRWGVAPEPRTERWPQR